MASQRLARIASGGLRKEAMSPHAWRRINLIAAIVWMLMIPTALYLDWIKSIAFVSAISLYANVASHIAAWRADVPDD